MRSKQGMLFVALLCVSTLGCKGGSDESSPSEPAADNQEAAAARNANLEPPAAAVAEFLEAVRTGDDVKTAEMFTAKARAQVAELGIAVTPEKSDTATFEVGEVEYINGGARVSATWTEIGGDGRPHTDPMLWMVRVGPEGWRIAGMAASVYDGEPPLLLDFENLKEAMRKLQMLKESIARSEQTAGSSPQTARQPTQPAGTEETMQR